MSEKQPVADAVAVARRLVDEMDGFDPSLAGVVRVAEAFAGVEFDVPDVPDADGFLFQYGRVSWFSEPTFSVSIIRQLEVADSTGEHESYVQVSYELRYAVDDDLADVAPHADWWFPGGSVAFGDWLESVRSDPIADVLAGRTPREFVVDEDEV